MDENRIGNQDGAGNRVAGGSSNRAGSGVGNQDGAAGGVAGGNGNRAGGGSGNQDSAAGGVAGGSSNGVSSNDWTPYMPPRYIREPDESGQPAQASPGQTAPSGQAMPSGNSLSSGQTSPSGNSPTPGQPVQPGQPGYIQPPGYAHSPGQTQQPARGLHPDLLRQQTRLQQASQQNAAVPLRQSLRPSAPQPRPPVPAQMSVGYYAAPQQPVQRRRQRGGAALLAAVCLFLAIGSGFAGGYFANMMRQADYDSSAPNIYQPYQPAETPQINNVTPYTEPTAPSDAVVPSILTNTASKPLLTIPEVAAAVRQSVVEIKTETITNGGWLGNYVAEGAGSGVIISADGYIVTNNHVISGAESITVRLSDGREFSAALIGTDAKTDIAVIKISATGLTPAVFGDSSKLVVGENAIAVGNPLGELGGTVTSGIISALDRDIIIDGETMSLLQTDAAVNPGNSGGGLFNLYGELIGVVNAKSGGLNVEGLGFAIPSNTAKAIINDLTAYGYVRGRIDDGLELVDIQTTQAARMYRVNQAGLYIYSSKDERLLSGDRITAVGGVMINRLSDYNDALKGCAVGDVVDITVARGTQTLTFDITLSEWKP